MKRSRAGGADLGHQLGARARPPRVAAEERGHRGRRGERHPAQPDALDHRGVADVACGVLAVRGPRAAARRRRCAASEMNQRPGMPASWMPTSVPLREISETTLDPATSARGQRRALGRGHRQVQEEVVVAGQEARRGLAAERRERGREVADQQVARGLAAHVQLVAHVQALGGQTEHVDRTAVLEQPRRARGPSSSRKKRSRSTDSSSPTPNHSVRPGPSLRVENARRAAVLDHPDRHRRRADAGHRPDVAVLVARGQRDLAALEQRAPPSRGRRPALEHAPRRAARGAAGRRRAPT